MPEDDSEPEEGENSSAPEFQISRAQQMSEADACDILRRFCNRDLQNAAISNDVPTLAELQAQVHSFLRDGKSCSG